ncbi:MAG: sigma-70 family RNA polymerase sigma factor [Myxococcota bacterium]
MPNPALGRMTSASPSGDAVDALDRYLRQPGQAQFRALEPFLTPIIHVAAANAARRDRHQRGRECIPDLMQEVWIHLLADDARVLRGFDPDRGSLPAYVGRIAYNRSRDRLRSPYLGDRTAQDAGTGALVLRTYDPEPSLEASDFLGRLVQYFERTLSGGMRQIFHRSFVEDQDSDATGQALGLSPSYILKCRSEIRRRAKSFRERHGSADERTTS